MDEKFAARYSGLLADKSMNAARASYSGFNQFMGNQMAPYGQPPNAENLQSYP